MIEASDQYQIKVYDHMHQKLLEAEIINADETYHNVFSQGRKESELKRTYIWMFRTGITADKAIVLYVHKGGRSKSIATTFLDGFHGYLQTDDYGGYNDVEGTRVLCHAHVRRKFVDIEKANKGCGSVEAAKKVIAKYRYIFHTDSKIREEYGNDYESIRKKRMEEIRPKLDDLFTYPDELVGQVYEKSDLYKAIQYARTNKKELYEFLKDGRLELTNNLAERSQKIVIIGRKNSMSLGSERGAQSSAVIYSLVQTARENGLVPMKYLNYLLEKLPQMEISGDLEDAME